MAMVLVDIDINYYNIKGYQNGIRASFFCHFFLSLFVEQRTLPLSPRVMRVRNCSQSRLYLEGQVLRLIFQAWLIALFLQTNIFTSLKRSRNNFSKDNPFSAV